MSTNVPGANPSNNIENSPKSGNMDSLSMEGEEISNKESTWKKSYTLVLVLNALYIVLFFIIMKIFS